MVGHIKILPSSTQHRVLIVDPHPSIQWIKTL